MKYELIVFDLDGTLMDCAKGIVLFDGVVPMLTDLKSSGVFIGLATNMGRGSLERILEQTGLDQYLCASRCATECAIKPAPDMVLSLMDFFAIEPSKTAMIGDSIFDIECGRNAGADAFQVNSAGPNTVTSVVASLKR